MLFDSLASYTQPSSVHPPHCNSDKAETRRKPLLASRAGTSRQVSFEQLRGAYHAQVR